MNRPNRALLLSIHPEHARKILAGTKTIELRRTRPRVAEGDWVLVYASSPLKELIGGFIVAQVVEGLPESLWRKHGSRAAISRELYDEYYTGAQRAYGILVDSVFHFSRSVSLARLRNALPGFTPPQSYRYLTHEDMKRAGLAAGKPAASS